MNGVDKKERKSSRKFFLFTGVVNNVSLRHLNHGRA